MPADTRVSSISGGKGVTLADGTALTARRGVVVAVDGPEAERLIGGDMQVGSGVGEGSMIGWDVTVCGLAYTRRDS